MILKPDEWSDERWARLIATLPLQRGGTLDDVAEAVLYCVRSDF